MIRFDDAGELLAATRLTEIVTLPELVFVTVNLSMIALALTAAYCVVCVISARLAGIKTVTETAMIAPTVGFD